MENPSTNRLRVELRSTNWRLDRPTAAIIPNMTQKMPPTIGLGMVRNREPATEVFIFTLVTLTLETVCDSLTELAEEPEHDHDGGAPLHHAPAAHLRHADGPDVLTL